MERIDLKLFRRFWAVSKPYWFSEEKLGARTLLALVVFLLIAFNGLSLAYSYANRNLINELTEKDISGFYHSLLLQLSLLIFFVPASVFYDYTKSKLGLYWRRWMTQSFLKKYFTNRAFYKIKYNKEIDNPDQRIAENIDSFIEECLSYSLQLLYNLGQLIAFIGVLWSINQFLVVFVFVAAAFKTLFTIVIGKKLIKLNFNQLQFQANFRYSLVHVRDNSESIAFYQGEEQELAAIHQKFADVFNNYNALIGWQRHLNFFTTGTSYIIPLAPLFVLAPHFFSGHLDFGAINQAIEAFTIVLDALSFIADSFQGISLFSAQINRLSTFESAVSQATTAPAPEKPIIDVVEDSRLALRRVTLETPNYERTLVHDVSVEVPSGKGVMVVGPSGTGKSSLLRAVAGLWKAGTGCIVRPKPEEILFLPQRPYMVMGSLRQQLLYPRTDFQVSDEVLQAALAEVNLSDLATRIGGFDVVLDWADVLSLGEQQRLAFARLLLTHPLYAVLDESTSALDVENEQQLYQLLKARQTTFISVGHRPTLIQYHDSILELQGQGKWQLIPVADFELS